MKSAEPVISCIPPGGRLLMKCSSLHSRQWLRVRGLLHGLAWLWLVPAGTHSHTSRSLERWSSCSITPSGRVTLPKWVLAPRMLVEPTNRGAGSWISGGGTSKRPWFWSVNS